MVPHDTLNELVELKLAALGAAETYAEAIKAQAEKYEVRAEVLRAVVTAAARDTLTDLAARTEEVSALLDVLAGEDESYTVTLKPFAAEAAP